MRIRKSIGEIHDGLFEFPAKEAGDAVRMEHFAGYRGVKSKRAKLSSGIKAAKRREQLQSKAGGGVHGHIEAD